MQRKPIILITGAGGRAGTRLANTLLENDFGKVVGVGHKECDLIHRNTVYELIAAWKPDYIFHLAAQSSIPFSWQDPLHTMNNNVMPAVHLFEAIRHYKLATRVLLAGSSEEYGLVYPQELPIRENNALRPLNPYGVSKVAMDLLGWQYFKNYGLPILRARSFNNLGADPNKPDVANDWIHQIARMEKGLGEPILKVGNLESKRDFVDIEDVVAAYWLILTQGDAGEVYNIASGSPISMQVLLDEILQLTSIKVKIVQDASKLRPSDVPIHCGDFSKLKVKTGWGPRKSLRESLKRMFDFWRKQVILTLHPLK